MVLMVNIIQEGGTTFMIPLVLIILTILGFFIASLVQQKNANKMKQLIAHFSLFGMIWGFLGSTIGLISAFDAIQTVDNVATPIVAGGLKVALLTTLLGLITFLIGRLCIIVITLKNK